jgi:hypothetical protein
MASTIDCGDFEISISIKLGVHARAETIDQKTAERMRELGEKLAAPKLELEAAIAYMLAHQVLGLSPADVDAAVKSRIDRLEKLRENERVGRAAKQAKRANR